MPLALRTTLGLAVIGQLFAILAAFGALNGWTICGVLLLVFGVRWRSHRFESGGKASALQKKYLLAILAILPLLLLALHPPLAFDETLYHLPFVRAIAQTGGIGFHPDIRNGVFPQLHELLCVPFFLFFGDRATHLVALLEVILLVALLVEWRGIVAAAFFLGNPIVIYLATVTYVDPALALFVAAGFYCLDREEDTAAGFLLGTACSVKYLGCYFAAAGLVYVILRKSLSPRASARGLEAGRREDPDAAPPPRPLAHARGDIARYLAALAAATLPMYGRIVYLTGHLFYPFGSESLVRASGAWRIFWDITFARARLGLEPPYSPLFAAAVLITLIAAFRDRRAAFLSAVVVGYLTLFMYLPRDSRYLLPLVPLVSVVAASVVRKHRVAIAMLALAPSVAYTAYRFTVVGLPPVNRTQYLEAHIPEYRALERRGPEPIYVCGAEQLKYYGGDDFYGDVIGPYTPERVDFAQLGIRYVLISKKHCPPQWQTPRDSDLVYADADAALWRVRARSATKAW